MKTLHTTGDWYAKDGQIVAQDTGKTLAVIPYYDNTDGEKTANANLMAAAPQMLAALKDLIAMKSEIMSDMDFCREGRSEMVESEFYQAEQAIQQATNP